MTKSKGEMFVAVLFVVFICWESVASSQSPIITRADYDIVQFPDCNGHQNSQDFTCDEAMKNGRTVGDKKDCTCKCKLGYVTYRDPFVTYDHETNSYNYDPNMKGCVWYAFHNEGCTAFKDINSLSYNDRAFAKPIIMNLTQSGNITLQAVGYHNSGNCVIVTPFVRLPGTNLWEKTNDIAFRLQKTIGMERLFQLQWYPRDGSRYQGSIIRLDLRQCITTSRHGCIMTKVAGTYTESTTIPSESPFPPSTPFLPSTSQHTPLTTTTKPTTNIPTLQTTEVITLELPTNESNHTTLIPVTFMPRLSKLTTVDILDPFTGSSSGGLGLGIGYIIAISLGLVLLLVGGLILGLCLCRRNKIGKNPARKETSSNEISNEEGPYATITLQRGIPPFTTSFINHGYHETVGMTSRGQRGVTRGYITTDTSPSGLQNADTVQSQPVYSIPEANYSLIVTPTRHASNTKPLPSSGCSSHIYSVLERENDPLKFPLPTDNDSVFVEFNPLYGSMDTLNVQTPEEQGYDNTGAVDEDSMEMEPNKRVSDIPEVSERDV